jgi:hypothetical protein
MVGGAGRRAVGDVGVGPLTTTAGVTITGE